MAYRFLYVALFICCFMLLKFGNVSFCLSQEGKDEKRKIENYIHGIDDSRMRLNTGVCHITGSNTIDGKTSVDDIEIAFDYKNDFYRFDRKGQCHSLRTPEYYYEFWHPGGQGDIVERQLSSARVSSHMAKPFDIRALGFFSFVGPYWNYEYNRDIRPKLFSDHSVSCKQLSDGLVLITTERVPDIPNASKMKREYWIAPNQGGEIVRAEYAGIDTYEMSWKEINRTWVPIAFKLNSTQSYSAEWKIDWLSVNEPVPIDYFDPSNLSEKPVILVSSELGELVQLGKTGKGLSLPGLPEKRKDYFLFRYILMGLGILMIAIALGKKIYDWRKRTSE